MNAYRRKKIWKMENLMAAKSVAAPAEELKPVVLEPTPEPIPEKAESPVAEVVSTEPVVEAPVALTLVESTLEKPVSKKKKGL